MVVGVSGFCLVTQPAWKTWCIRNGIEELQLRSQKRDTTTKMLRKPRETRPCKERASPRPDTQKVSLPPPGDNTTGGWSNLYDGKTNNMRPVPSHPLPGFFEDTSVVAVFPSLPLPSYFFSASSILQPHTMQNIPVHSDFPCVGRE